MTNTNEIKALTLAELIKKMDSNDQAFINGVVIGLASKKAKEKSEEKGDK